MSFSKNKFSLLSQNSVTDVYVGFRPPCWSSSRWALAWLTSPQTSFGVRSSREPQKTSAGRLQRGVSIQISIIWVKHSFGYLVYEIFLWPESWWGSLYMYFLSFPRFWTLYLLNGFDFYFDLFWMGLTLKTSNKSVTNTQANNNNNNNTLYLYDCNKVLQCCKSYLKLIIDSF